MLSRATYAGRICLSCRYQLRLIRPRPLPATTRLPRLALPRYSTAANHDADSNPPKSSQSEAEEGSETTGQVGRAPEQQDPESTTEGKQAESSTEAEPTPEASSEESRPESRPNESETNSVEVETDTSPLSSPDLPWEDLEAASRLPGSHSGSQRTESSRPKERGPRRKRGRNGVDIETASLGMNILGKEGHTIVLRDREDRRKKPDTLEEETPAKRFNIEGSLEEQDRDLTAEETRRNIEELRPGDSQNLVGREFEKLVTTLMEGFTTSQLEDYVCYFMRRAEGKSELMPESQQRHLLKRLTGQQRAEQRWAVRPRYSWIRQQFSWKPPKNYPWGNTMKEKLVLAMMRTCWQLQVMEETRYIGQVNTTVDPHILNLLLGKNLPLCHPSGLR